MHRCLPVTRLSVVLAALAVAAALGVRALHVAPASAAGAGRLQQTIAADKARERALSGAAARLGRLERETRREVRILQRRVTAAQAALVAAEGRLQRTTVRLGRARARVARLRVRLRQVRGRLARLLRARYMSDRPDVVSVVLNAHGFSDLLETVSFLQRVQHQDARLLGLVRAARRDAAQEQRVLGDLQARQRTTAEAVRRRRDALAGMAAGLRVRQAALARARAARLAALGHTRASRRRAEKALARLLAERARATREAGPGGPWAIPWPVVQCESGGQNLPPNSATASGYYQIIDPTWQRMGGSTPHAYQAPKAEQDRIARELWNGGGGAGNWDCAALVGIV